MNSERSWAYAAASLTARKACCKLLLFLVMASPVFYGAWAQTLIFPTEVERFIKMTQVQQKEHESSVMDLQIRGSGKVSNVEECGFSSRSKLHGRDCYEIIVDRGAPRAVIYVSKTERSRVIRIQRGDEYAFSGCMIRGLKNFGFWSTVYCDLPRQDAVNSQVSRDAPQSKRPVQTKGDDNNFPPEILASLRNDYPNTKLSDWRIKLRQDMNGDGKLDYVLSIELNGYCGSAGCRHILYYSTPSGFKSISETWREFQVDGGKTLAGYPIYYIILHGVSCDEPGYKSCEMQVNWTPQQEWSIKLNRILN